MREASNTERGNLHRVLKMEMRPRASLFENPNNARTHNREQRRLIAASIRTHGFINPIIVDRDGMILAGHARWAAAGELNLGEVPVICLEDMTEADKRAYVLADNRLAELAGWDREMVAEELRWLLDSDYEIQTTGFKFSDADFQIDLGNAKPSASGKATVELPTEDQETVTIRDDLWHIGPHRLLCANSLDVISFERLLGDDRAQMVFSDAPYNVPIHGHVSGQGKVVHREFVMASGEMSPSEFTYFLRAIMKNLVRFSIDGSIHYQCMDWRHAREMLDAAEGVYSEQKNLCVWKKDNAGLGSFYRSAHELIFVFKSGRKKHINNFSMGEGPAHGIKGRYRTNVMEYAGANTFRKGREADLQAHSTVKPLDLVADLILDCSSRGGLILDPFSGSGTTLAAAHITGRRGAAIEMDEAYVDCALRRLWGLSGIEPIHANGKVFSEIEAERRLSEAV